MNYLGTAAKMYIENERQELRISIALYRNPTFHDAPEDEKEVDGKKVKTYKEPIQRNELAKNIRDLQILIIKKCIQVYKFIDYIADKRKKVPLKYITNQPPPYILNALFYKMKADQLRYIYECMSGDNGLYVPYQTDNKFKMNFESNKPSAREGDNHN